MIELFQFSWSPFCLPQRRILEFSGARFKIINVPPQRRDLVWKLKLGLFPAELEGVQSILWRHIENEVEGATFRLNDIHYRENHRREKLSAADELQYLRFKERKFGRGCIGQWRAQKAEWLKKLEASLMPFEQSLAHGTFLLGEQPRFVDFDLMGMLDNYLYSGRYRPPKTSPLVRRWYGLMKTVCAGVD